MAVPELHFFAANDVNGATILEVPVTDQYVERIVARPALRELGYMAFRFSRQVGFAIFDSGAFQPETFVRLLVPDVSTTRYLWGCFLNDRVQQLVARVKAGENFDFGGPGPKHYLSRAILWDEQFFGTGYNIDLANGVFRWKETASAGRVLTSLINDDANNTIAQFLPDLTKSFGNSDDSNGDPWVNDIAGTDEFELRIGDDFLTDLFKIEDSGDLETTMYLGTVATPVLRLDAWQAYGRDLGGPIGAATVHFKEAVNILSDLSVAGASQRKASHTLVEGLEGAYGHAVRTAWDPGEYAKAVGISHDTTKNEAVLNRYGLAWLRRQANNENEILVPHYPGFSQATGLYFPGPGSEAPGGAATSGHYWLGDTVSLTTGGDSGGTWTPLDYRSEDQRVMAITMEMRSVVKDGTSTEAALSWNVIAELNVERGSDTVPEASAGSGGMGCNCIALCDNSEGFISTDVTWRALNIIGVSPPAGWNGVGFDDSDWSDAELYTATGAYVMAMGTDDAGRKEPSDKILLRREYFIDDDDLTGAAVVFQYALDNAGVIYVNGVAVVTLGPDFTNTAGHYTGNHATTLARSNFRAGFNCVAIYANNDAAGSSGATPPGATSGAVYIEMPTTNGTGGDARAARCDHHHHAGELDENVEGNVQDRLDALADAIAEGLDDDALEADRAAHGRFVATYHRASDTKAIVMYSDDGITFRDGAQIDVNGSRRDPSLIHWDGKFWVVLTHGTTSLRLYESADLETWSGPTTILVDAGATQSWAPEWIRNLDGTPFLHPSTGLPCATVNVSTDSETTFTVREIHPTNRTMTTWSSPVTVTGTGLPTKMIDAALYADGDDYWLWFKEETNKRIEIVRSTTALTSGYTVFESADWAGWFAAKDAGANSIEGPSLVRLEDGRWRIYFNENNGFTSIRAVYSETTDDWRTGTSTWTTQAVITTDALMSHGTVNRIASVYDHQRDPDAHGGVVTDHGGLTGLTDDDHTQYLDAARHTATDHSAVVESAGRWEPVTNGVDTFVWDGAEIVVHFVET